MNSVNKTLYIPLYGKAYVSRRGLFLDDKKAEQIWEAEGFELKGKSKSKWLAYYMGVRAAVFDEWVMDQISQNPGAVVLHIGCGMDSRAERVDHADNVWYDIDFPEVIEERKRYYTETVRYKMISADVREGKWLSGVAQTATAIVVMEGVSMYMGGEQMRKLADDLSDHFETLYMLVDAYSVFAAKMSKYKNPVNDVGVTEVYGIDNPDEFETNKLRFVCEREMTPQKYVNELKGFEKRIFSKLYAGKFSQKLYRLFEYQKS